MAGITIRLRMPADDAALARLLIEMQAHYQRPCPPEETIRADLANLPAGVEILVASAGAIIGFAAVSAIYPGPGLGSGLFLKELFVSKAFRSTGVGVRLLRGVARMARERGHKRVDWTTDRNNPRLLTFYASLGAVAQDDKAFFRLSGDAFAALADGPDI
ncbi:MAG TPA: GNAT family N-acetyltransferase [Dongiaceae bacterium]|jgi:GNAT superfamily N-acetyltransferase|nr:GNAT family N-acetyltransferase [Dongiaceae bacterium]